MASETWEVFEEINDLWNTHFVWAFQHRLPTPQVLQNAWQRWYAASKEQKFGFRALRIGSIFFVGKNGTIFVGKTLAQISRQLRLKIEQERAMNLMKVRKQTKRAKRRWINEGYRLGLEVDYVEQWYAKELAEHDDHDHGGHGFELLPLSTVSSLQIEYSDHDGCKATLSDANNTIKKVSSMCTKTTRPTQL